MHLILLGTSACHLCEEAQALLARVLIQFPQTQLELVDIADQNQWQSRYALKIPVLYHTKTLSELNWPFNEADIMTFILTLNHD
jgi:hypothetical protein